MYLFIGKTWIHLSLFKTWIRGIVGTFPANECIECDGLVTFCPQPNSFTSLLHLFVTHSCCSGDLPFLKHTIPWYYSWNLVSLRLSSPYHPSDLRALSKTSYAFIKCEVLAFAKVKWKIFILLWTNNWVWVSLQAAVSRSVPSFPNGIPC